MQSNITVKIQKSGEILVNDNGTCHRFSNFGEYVGVVDIGASAFSGFVRLPILSVITSSKDAELAIVYENGSNKIIDSFKIKDPFDILMSLQTKGGYLKALKSKGTVESSRYNQMVFIYKTGTDLDSLVTGLF